jgi:hypothetical protein
LFRISTTTPNRPGETWKESSRTNLETVTDPKDGHAEIEHGRVDPGRVFIVYRVRGSGEDDTCDTQRYIERTKGERDGDGGVNVKIKVNGSFV